MKKINEILGAHRQGLIDKPSFIREMYEMHHAGLFDYAQHLGKTNIKKIEVEDGRVIMTSRDRGLRMICVPGDYRVAPFETLNFLDYEKSDSTMIERLFTDGDVFFDIGANMGWYSINIALSKRTARVHSFEPIRKTYGYLQQNLELNAVHNVTAYNFGFSNHSGEIDFYYYDEGSGNASSANVSNRDDVQVQRCKVRTLDDFTTKMQTTVDFIKCDVEGAELMVFQGGTETIKRDCPIIFSEILRKWSAKFNYNPNEIFDFFRSINYRSFTTDGNELNEFFVMDESTTETNFFFLHAEKHARKIHQLSNRRS
jgi:FkbM family methyltransferase